MKTLKKAFVRVMLSIAIVFSLNIVSFAADENAEFIKDEAELYPIIREAFVNRESTFTIKYANEGLLDDDYFERWIDGAVQETGVPNEGDYLERHLGEVNASGEIAMSSDGMCYYTLEVQANYYTTKEQEDAVAQEVNRVLDMLAINYLKSDYDKIEAIYGYICDNVVYDYDTLYDDAYKLKYTAYAALINKTSVCQGYANLLYRMLHEVGIDSRIITGTGNGGDHAWNIVELGNKYYYLDATWDAVYTEYEFFLRGTTDFYDHANDNEFLTDEFFLRYPIPETGYAKCAEHVFGEYISNEDATCTEDGTKTAFCVVCGEEDTVTDEGSALGHQFEACMGTDPTCTEAGFEEYACVRCWDVSVTYRVELPAAGHVFKKYVSDENATCTEDGTKTAKCENCDEKDVVAEEGSAIGHKFEACMGTDPTCGEAGFEEFACVKCWDPSVTYRETIPATGNHTYSNWIVDAEATCTVAGSKHKECAGCGDVVTEEIAASHAWDELFTIDKETTCKEAGSKSIHCAKCEEVKEITEIAKLDHTYGDWILDAEPTCTVAGSKHKECTSCGNVVTEEIAASHAWDELYTIDKEATCAEAGSKSIHCANCEEVKDVTEIAKLDHIFGDWYTVEESTTTVKGYDQRDCENCDAYETRDKVLCTWKKDSKGWYFLDGDGNRVCNQWVQDSYAYCFLNASGYMVYNKWCLDETGWAYAGSNGYRITNKWIKDSTGWSYVDESGYMVYSQWVKDSVGWCYVDENGYMATNKWVSDSKGLCYVGSDGYIVKNKWVKDSSNWCYLGADGYKVTNKWVKDSVGWCYLDSEGYMVTNEWVPDSVGLCYIGSKGYILTNQWVKDNYDWCYLDKNGYKVTNKWVKDSVGWCYIGADGYMVYEQWVADSKGWCYVNESGYMVYSEWIYIEDEEHRYYVDENGYRVENQWKKIGANEYYFKEDGVMAAEE